MTQTEQSVEAAVRTNNDPKSVYLAPECMEGAHEGCCWSEDNVWDECDCDPDHPHKPVKYIRADLASQSPASADGRVSVGDGWAGRSTEQRKAIAKRLGEIFPGHDSIDLADELIIAYLAASPTAPQAVSRDAVTSDILAAAWEVVTHPNYMTLEECATHNQTPGPANRLKSALLALKSPQSIPAPDAKPDVSGLLEALAEVLVTRGTPAREEYLNDQSFLAATDAHIKAKNLLAAASRPQQAETER